MKSDNGNETGSVDPRTNAHSALGPVLDFGGSLAQSQCACGFGRRESRSFDHTPKAPHDPFKQKPPSVASLF